MRTLRLITAVVILCAALAGSGGAQKQDKKNILDVPTEAWAERRTATLSSMIAAWTRCNAKDTTRRWCEIYKEQLRQMPLEDLIIPEAATVFKTRFTAAEIELVKGSFFELTTTGYVLGDKKSYEDCKKCWTHAKSCCHRENETQGTVVSLSATTLGQHTSGGKHGKESYRTRRHRSS